MRADLNQMDGPAGAVAVEPRTMRLLMIFAERPREVISRRELIDAVWGEVAVTEESLTRCVSDLRRLFDDDPRRPRIIQTIQRRGYRLIAPVERVGEGEGRSGTDRGRRNFRAVGATVLLALAVAVGLFSWSRSTRDEASPVTLARPVTALDGAEVGPALSPDGEHLIFGWVAGEDPFDLDLYLSRIDGGEPRRLTDSPGIETAAAWSPDGRRLAFLRQSSIKSEGAGCELVQLDLASGRETGVSACGVSSPGALAWFPDGRHLLLSDRTEPDAPFRLLRVSVENPRSEGGPRLLTEPPTEQYGDVFPALSPDGRQIAFVRATAPAPILGQLGAVKGRLHRVPSAGGESRGVGPTQEFLGLEWGPDGRSLVYLGAVPGRGWGLYRLDLASETTSVVVPPSGTVRRNLRAAQRGRRLAFEEWAARTDLWRRSLDSSSPEAVRFAGSTQWESDPAFSSDGREVAFVSTRSGAHEIWVASADGGAVRQVTRRGLVRTAGPAFAPDGQSIAFESETGEGLSIFVVDARGDGEARLVSTGKGEDRGASWSADGRWIYFASDRGGSWQVWRVRPERGSPEQVTRGGGLAPQEVVLEGESLILFARPEGSGLWAVSPEGGEERKILDASPSFGPWDWVVVGDDLYFSSRTAEGSRLMTRPLAGGSARPLASLAHAEAVSLSRFTVSPDGRWLVSAEHRDLKADIFVVDHLR